MITRLVKKGATLTWSPGLSSDPGSGMTVAPAAVAALAAVVAVAAVAAGGAPEGDHPLKVVVAAGSEG
jgi:hypothetical protein